MPDEFKSPILTPSIQRRIASGLAAIISGYCAGWKTCVEAMERNCTVVVDENGEPRFLSEKPRRRDRAGAENRTGIPVQDWARLEAMRPRRRRLMPKAAAAPSTGRGPGTGRGAFTVRLQLLMLNGSPPAPSSKSRFQVPLPLSPMKALNEEEGK